MSRVATKGPPPAKVSNLRGSTVETRYYKWLHLNCTCCVTGQPAFDIAHTGGLAQGKGMSRKAWLQTCLPLIRPLHRLEEGKSEFFWPTVGLPNYLDDALALYQMFERGISPDADLEAMQGRIDQEYVATLLGEIDF